MISDSGETRASDPPAPMPTATPGSAITPAVVRSDQLTSKPVPLEKGVQFKQRGRRRWPMSEKSVCRVKDASGQSINFLKKPTRSNAILAAVAVMALSLSPFRCGGGSDGNGGGGNS